LLPHFAEAHLRPLPAVILQAQRGHDDPDRRVIAMLGVRRLVPRGNSRDVDLNMPEISADAVGFVEQELRARRGPSFVST
jgi:hypothetical protein